jgi:hypothetical protein
MSRLTIFSLRNIAAALAGATLLGFALVEVTGGFDKPNRESAEQAHADQEPPGFALSVTEEGATYNYRPAPAEEHEEPDWWGVTFEGWIALLTGVLAVGTGYLALYTARLWGSTKEAVDDARESGERELRAYLHVRDMEVSAVTMGNQRTAQYQVEIQNCGKTPGYRCCAHISWATFPTEPKDFSFFDVYGEQIGVSVFDVGPGQSTRMTERIPMERFRAIAAGTEYCLMWGWVEYSDVFPDSKRRRTEFAYRIRVEDHGTQFATWGSHYHHYNNSDAGCTYPAMTCEQRLAYWADAVSIV